MWRRGQGRSIAIHVDRELGTQEDPAARRIRQGLDALWDEMFQLRQQVAKNAGFEDFRDYIFKAKMRDYGPDECFEFHDRVESEVVPSRLRSGGTWCSPHAAGL